MRIRTHCRPLSSEHASMVDLVRRGDPPSYARTETWVNWADPGDNVSIFRIRSGDIPELTWQSAAPASGKPEVLVLLPEESTTFQQIVSSIEALRRDHADARIWLAPVRRSRGER